MKEFLAGWVVFQLIMIGFILGGFVYEEQKNGCLKSPEKLHKEWEYKLAAMVFPLVAFVENDFNYCDTAPLPINY